jgi:hypothetical protein
MATMKKPIAKAQNGIKKKIVKKLDNPVNDYKNMVNPETGKKGQMGGEGTNPPLNGSKLKKGTKIFNGVTGKYDTVKKNGGSIKKAKTGVSLKSVPSDKVGLGKLPTPVRNKMGYKKDGGTIKAKAGGKMKTCKGGC